MLKILKKINLFMEKFAVVGNPISHSKSPTIFNYAFKYANINAKYFKYKFNNAKQAIDFFHKENLTGINVTAPFKETIIPFIDVIDNDAKQIGSINTIIKKKDLLYGYNTDYIGVLESFKHNNISLKNKKCLIIGAGGTAKAVIFALNKEKTQITIANRTIEKAQYLAQKYNCKYTNIKNLREEIQKCDILAFTVDTALYSINPDYIKPNLVIFDVNYKTSKFKHIAEAKNGILITGKQLLVRQAVKGFEYFTGKTINEDVMFEAIN